jgi:hypothetical protein
MTEEEIAAVVVAGCLEGRLVKPTQPRFRNFKWLVWARARLSQAQWYVIETDLEAAATLHTGVLCSTGQHWSHAVNGPECDCGLCVGPPSYNDDLPPPPLVNDAR